MKNRLENDGRITIAHIISGLGATGGVQKIVYDIASNLDIKSYKQVVFCLYEVGTLGNYLIEQGIPVYCLSGKSSPNPLYFFSNLKTIWQLKKYFLYENVHIVHTHEFFSGTIGRMAAIIAGVPIKILMLHIEDSWKRKIHILVDRILAHWTDVIVTNSYYVENFTVKFEKISHKKFDVIYNGIDTDRFIFSPAKRRSKRAELGLDNDTRVLSILSRLTEYKGHRFLIESLPEVLNQFPNLRLLIVGDETFDISFTEEIRQLVKDLGCVKNVAFLGWQEDLVGILCATDIFVLPSLREGFGLVIAEAMATEKPVVAAKSTAIPEVVSDGKTGILVPCEDSNSIAEAVLFLLNNPQISESMGKKGRKRVERYFSINAMVSGWDKLYSNLVQKKLLV